MHKNFCKLSFVSSPCKGGVPTPILKKENSVFCNILHLILPRIVCWIVPMLVSLRSHWQKCDSHLNLFGAPFILKNPSSNCCHGDTFEFIFACAFEPFILKIDDWNRWKENTHNKQCKPWENSDFKLLFGISVWHAV